MPPRRGGRSDPHSSIEKLAREACALGTKRELVKTLRFFVRLILLYLNHNGNQSCDEGENNEKEFACDDFFGDDRLPLGLHEKHSGVFNRLFEGRLGGSDEFLFLFARLFERFLIR
jgi:hypothetical protein